MPLNFRSFMPHDIRLGQEGRPVVKNNHQSARPGLFICGDLARALAVFDPCLGVAVSSRTIPDRPTPHRAYQV